MAGIHNPLAVLAMRAMGVRVGRGTRVCGFPVFVRSGGSSIKLGEDRELRMVQ